MQIKNDKKQEYQDWYNKNLDPYGHACFVYAENWASMMEDKIQNGFNLEDIAEQTSHDADTEGITGFMYGMAAQILAYCWVYGEQLRRWHNLEYQIGNEGEKANEEGKVLNPSVINIG